MLSLGLVLSTLLFANTLALAQLDASTTPAFEPRIEPTEDTGGTGSRGPVRDDGTCIADSDRITLLVPPTSPLMTAAWPGFIAVLPPVTDETVSRGELRIFDDEGTLYRSTFPLPEGGGTLELSPPAIPDLQADVAYQWSVRILCHEVDNTKNPISVGTFRLAEPTPEVQSALGDDTCEQHPALCASDGIWYDPLAGVFEARLADPDNPELDAAWISLLESAELGEYVEVPLVGRWVFEESQTE
jgi:hypothetical protein